MEPNSHEQQAIRTVIQRQLDAFLRDDAQAAFACASESARERFSSADAFLENVKRRMPPVYRPKRIAFDTLLDYAGQPAQQLLLQGVEGEPVLAIYVMRLEQDGHWRIDACLLYGLTPPTSAQGKPLVN